MNSSHTIARIALAAAVSAFTLQAAIAADIIFDFETKEEIKAASRLNRPTYRFSVTNFCASSGQNAFNLSADRWESGDYEWPAFSLKTKITDWSAYDRLAVDLVNLGDDGDMITVEIAGPEGKASLGLSRSFQLPAWEYRQVVIDLAYWPKTADPKNITRIHVFSGRPQSLNAFFDRFTLLKPGEKLPPPPRFDARTSGTIREGRAAYDARRKAQREKLLSELFKANAKAGIKSGAFLVGRASSMDGIRPKDTYDLNDPVEFSLRLARNETEAVQLIVTPTRGDISDVKVEISPMRLKTSFWKRPFNKVRLPKDVVRACPVGYVKTTSRPCYGVGYNVKTNEAPGYKRLTKRAPLGWWPDPILSFLDSVDVKAGDVQSFWISARIPENAEPGVYNGAIRVTADDCKPVYLPFTVQVDPFVIPKTPPIPMLISFSPGVYVRPDQHGARDRVLAEAAKAKADSPLNLWQTKKSEWANFLADRFITMAPIYQHSAKLPYDIWADLKAQGRMGTYNMCYFSSQPFDTPERLKSWTAWSDWIASVIERRYKEAVQYGIEKHAVVYCCDEAGPKRFPEIDGVLKKLKKRFPHIRFATTSFDDTFGMSGTLEEVDIFIPQTVKFDPAAAEKSRKAGHKVWWYYACDQKAPYANVFTESQPIEQRLLMGAKAARWRPDGFLYYQIAYFNSLDCITSGPYTSWDPRSWWREHGDGTWVAVGPGGIPLSTLRLENFRDGIEDLWYAELLRKKLESSPDAPWAQRAKELLAVPRSVVDTLENYTDSEKDVYRWRNEMADILSR
jgi:hypothetical protein